jgi:hypothetical protein
MKVGFLSILGIIILNSCNKVKSMDNSTRLANNKNIENSLRKKIIGIWTSEGSINTDFKIDEKSFYYVEDFASYKYSLKGDSITISYPDYDYKGKVSFKQDTLILSTEDRDVKYWRFKE